MFEGWDPVGDIQKGASEFQENTKIAFDKAGKGLVDAKNGADHFVQNAQVQVQRGAGEAFQNAQKGANHVREDMEKGAAEARGNVERGLGNFREHVVEEPLRKFAEAMDEFFNSTLPGAALGGKSSYKHIPGSTPHESILLSATLLELREGSVLRGLCQQTDGTWSVSEIDLNDYYSADGGMFSAGSAGYKGAARNLWLEPGESSVRLHGRLGESRAPAQVDLSICIIVKDGNFAFEKHDGPWDRDGFLARKTEGVPVIGYITAAVQNGKDDQDHAHRALARCTSSTIVTVAAIAGYFLKGPLGAGVAAGLSTSLAMLAESHIVRNIDDPRLRDEFEQATIGRAISEALTNAIGGEAGGHALQHVASWLSSSGTDLVAKAIEGIKVALSCVTLGLSKEVVDSRAGAGQAVVIALIEKIVQALRGDEMPLKDWASVIGSLEKRFRNA